MTPFEKNLAIFSYQTLIFVGLFEFSGLWLVEKFSAVPTRYVVLRTYKGVPWISFFTQSSITQTFPCLITHTPPYSWRQINSMRIAHA